MEMKNKELLLTFSDKQGRIHGNISRGRVGRSGKPRKVTLLPTDGRTDGPTDRKVAYRVACPRLKKFSPFAFVFFNVFKEEVNSHCQSLLFFLFTEFSLAT